MGNNNPYWFASSLGAIFAGGLSCGIYLTNSAETVKYICHQAPLDLMVLQNELLLENLKRQEPQLCEVIKCFILMEPSKNVNNNSVINWNDLIDIGEPVSDEVLIKKKNDQAVNQACMLMYTSGTTGPPKGK